MNAIVKTANYAFCRGLTFECDKCAIPDLVNSQCMPHLLILDQHYINSK